MLFRFRVMPPTTKENLKRQMGVHRSIDRSYFMGIHIEPLEKACDIILGTWYIKRTSWINEVMLIIDQNHSYFFTIFVCWLEPCMLSSVGKLLDAGSVDALVDILIAEERRCRNHIGHTNNPHCSIFCRRTSSLCSILLTLDILKLYITTNSNEISVMRTA